MKKLFTLSVLLSLCLSNFAQITFLSTDVPVANPTWLQPIRKDTLPLPTINYGNKGANQVYNFSNLTPFRNDTIEYRTPTSTQLTNLGNAPDAAITQDGVNFLFTKTVPNSKLTLQGFEGIAFGTNISANYSPVPDIYRFPTQYNGNFSGSSTLTKTLPGSQVGQPVDQVRLTVTTSYTDTVDGWGKTITPVGAYKSLRVKRKEVTTTVSEYKLFSFSQWAPAPGSPSTRTTVRYSYLTKETKGSVITFEYDSVDNLLSASYSLIPPNAPIANFSFVVGSGGSVAFTDLSDNYPTSWSWNFGDGSPLSTQQNPTHVFTANGNYNVCLVATNAGGSSTSVCKQVTITGLAVAPVAAFAWSNTSGGLVNFTDQSTNVPTSWSWNFGDGSALSAQQNPNHVYAANNTYNVCLTATNGAGSNQHCANVVVTGVSAANSAPVAFDDTVSLTQGGSIPVLHVAGNDVDPDGDNICLEEVWGSPFVAEVIGGSCDMVSITPDTGFVGIDTAWYRLCDNGSPVLCDTALIIFTVNAVINRAPVATDDNTIVSQPNGVVRNVGNNDTDPDGDNICITSVYGSPAFADAGIGNCTSIRYTPDSTFTGSDTCWYIICDNGSPVLCDTGMFVVNSIANPALLPVASFSFNCNYGSSLHVDLINTSSNSTGLAQWKITQTAFMHAYPDSLFLMTGDTVSFTPVLRSELAYPDSVFACLVVSNAFGQDSTCQYTCLVVWESIREISLSGIQLYPNPANNIITIDMTLNQEEATRNYSAIEIYNALGERVKLVGENTNKGNKLVNISLAELTGGMYQASLLDSKGTRRSLGRFVVQK